MTQRLFEICQFAPSPKIRTQPNHTEEERLYLFQIERNLYESADCGGTLNTTNLWTRKREKERERDIPYFSVLERFNFIHIAKSLKGGEELP